MTIKGIKLNIPDDVFKTFEGFEKAYDETLIFEKKDKYELKAKRAKQQLTMYLSEKALHELVEKFQRDKQGDLIPNKHSKKQKTFLFTKLLQNKQLYEDQSVTQSYYFEVTGPKELTFKLFEEVIKNKKGGARIGA